MNETILNILAEATSTPTFIPCLKVPWNISDCYGQRQINTNRIHRSYWTYKHVVKRACPSFWMLHTTTAESVPSTQIWVDKNKLRLIIKARCVSTMWQFIRRSRPERPWDQWLTHSYTWLNHKCTNTHKCISVSHSETQNQMYMYMQKFVQIPVNVLKKALMTQRCYTHFFVFVDKDYCTHTKTHIHRKGSSEYNTKCRLWLEPISANVISPTHAISLRDWVLMPAVFQCRSIIWQKASPDAYQCLNSSCSPSTDIRCTSGIPPTEMS